MNLAIVGQGVMGRLVKAMALECQIIETVSTVEPLEGESLFDIPVPDVIIDFSHPETLETTCRYLRENKGKTAVVFATTGFSEEDKEKINELGHIVPVMRSSNYSYGIHTVKKILQQAVPLLGDRSDMEIIERHHRLKADAPSGTALMLAEICDPNQQRKWISGRQGESRRSNEIGIHSIRGGTIFGEHTVLFALEDEVIEIRHTAFSKRIFAQGAIEAALWLNGKKPGIYSIEEVFFQ